MNVNDPFSPLYFKKVLHQDELKRRRMSMQRGKDIYVGNLLKKVEQTAEENKDAFLQNIGNIVEGK